MVEHTLEEKEELLKTVQEEHNKIQNVSGGLKVAYAGFDERTVSQEDPRSNERDDGDGGRTSQESS